MQDIELCLEGRNREMENSDGGDLWRENYYFSISVPYEVI